jgi:AcrR family transcriptional regulator
MGTRQRILEAGLAVFGAYGYRRASMERVAAQAGLSRQALYRHFPGKEALFEAVVESLHASALAAAAEAARAARAAGEDAAGVLLAQLEAHAVALLSRLRASPHAEELIDENDRRCGVIAAAAGERFAAQLAATARAEARAGRLALRRDVPVRELARLLIAGARGLKAESPAPSLDAFRRALASLVRLLVGGAER